jgi:hypothetical protein
MGDLLGDYSIPKRTFRDVEGRIDALDTPELRALGRIDQHDAISRLLLELIKEEAPFSLDCLVDFMGRIREKGLGHRYAMATFELWLNTRSGLSDEENREVRGRLVGKYLPRDAYQRLFPIGMNKYHDGTHFVTAHSSPDLDTTVASFWGWIDAFAARLTKGLHVWNVPGGPPLTQVEIGLLFHDLFGPDTFQFLSKSREALTLTSLDLMTHEGVITRHESDYSLSVDHDRQSTAVVIVNEQGQYRGDWRHFDVEGVRQVVTSLNNCLRWMESHWHIELISLFAKDDLSADDIAPFIDSILGQRIEACEPAKEFTPKQRDYLNTYLEKVLGVEGGLQATFAIFSEAMHTLSIADFTPFISMLRALGTSELFDEKGEIIEHRPRIFHHLEELVSLLSSTFRQVRKHVDRLDIALQVKSDVFGFKPQSLSMRADIEEVRSKINSYPYLTVTEADVDDERRAIGVVYASTLRKAKLGTVTLRDFCNREETKIPAYLEVISAIDHHKVALETSSPLTALFSDAQSANTLVAELAFTLNDAYGMGGSEKGAIESQLSELEKSPFSPSTLRIRRRLLDHLGVSLRESPFFVDPRREFVEYLHFLYAILDDTDLLTKVSKRDVEVVASLLNRLKSLADGKETEIISFDDIRHDEAFTEMAAKRLVQNPDFHSLYSKVYAQKEEAIEENLTRCMQGESSSIFIDTKILNECARVGQTKLFERNYAKFLEYAPQIRHIWYSNAIEIAESSPAIDLHLHMVSTIASADELFDGERHTYEHKDELWVWIPDRDLAVEHLTLFLTSFGQSMKERDHNFEVEFLQGADSPLAELFKESFLPVPHIVKEGMREEDRIPVAIIHFKAGLLNSRKGMIAPHIPKLRRA